MIRELRVTCLAYEAVAPDIGLRLRRGDSTWLPADAIHKSVILRGLVEVGAVLVHLEKRYASLRPTLPVKSPRVRQGTPSATPNTYTRLDTSDPVYPHQKTEPSPAVAQKRRGRKSSKPEGDSD